MKLREFAVVAGLIILTRLAQSPSTDSEIRSEIVRRIGSAAGVSVQVRGGVVTLTGTVPNLARRLGIVNQARRTVGVREIEDAIRVVPPDPRPDAELAEAVRASLARNLGSVESRAVQVRVENGVVVLTGTLTGSYPKELAGSLAALVPGVTGLRNEITVRPAQRRTDAQIRDDLRSRYRTNPLVPEGVSVSVENGVVTLTGTVMSFVQVEQAETIARFTPGVVGVENRLFVSG